MFFKDITFMGKRCKKQLTRHQACYCVTLFYDLLSTQAFLHENIESQIQIDAIVTTYFVKSVRMGFFFFFFYLITIFQAYGSSKTFLLQHMCMSYVLIYLKLKKQFGTHIDITQFDLDRGCPYVRLTISQRCKRYKLLYRRLYHKPL